mgnify:CR=1 FL=1
MRRSRIENLQGKFLSGDCEKVLRRFPDDCIDLVLTSPPYADKRDYGTEGSSVSADDYVTWFLPKARQIYRVLKPNGSFVLNISDKVVDDFQHLYVFDLVLALCKKVGFHLVRDYIWYNPATPPNVYSRGGYGRTKKSHEYCFWFSKSNEWTFNLDPIRKPYSRDMLRYLKGEGKGDRQQNTRPSTHNFDCEKIWNNNGGSDPGSVIKCGNTSSNDAFMKLCKERGISHPARFPEKLVEFFILSGTNPGDLVLDPFSGSGTTAVVAAVNGRRWVGIDMNEVFCELAAERMKLKAKEEPQ